MSSKNKFATIVVVVFLAMVIAVGVVGAKRSKSANSLEAKTAMSVEEFSKAPADAANKIMQDYFAAVMARNESGESKEGDATAPLGFEIMHTDASDSEDIKVSVKFKYADEFDYPAVDYHIVKKADAYQVQKQRCEFDMDPDSPNRGTAKCTSSSAQ
ncbi:hypothetical protein [Paenibacillus glycinis]|uniref:Uncharacterized protein n=1 Tax=Paenibacillus glycinis TaxID=2697035 RepID=A0ABW9XS37_9BACL|nr:hypothetical protein [Paenibacillus glycinis]NBD25470.1 hypothetical protein [Paenibacillus glycinis]